MSGLQSREKFMQALKTPMASVLTRKHFLHNKNVANWAAPFPTVTQNKSLASNLTHVSFRGRHNCCRSLCRCPAVALLTVGAHRFTPPAFCNTNEEDLYSVPTFYPTHRHSFTGCLSYSIALAVTMVTMDLSFNIFFNCRILSF